MARYSPDYGAYAFKQIVGTKPKGISEQNMRSGIKAILSKWARNVQAENVQRLRNATAMNGDAMRPLSRLWSLYKNVAGLSPEIGQATGKMLQEHGSAKNIRIDMKGDAITVTIAPCQTPETLKKIQWFQSAWKQTVKSEKPGAMQRKLEIMAEQAGIKDSRIVYEIGFGIFADNIVVLNHPARRWIKGSEKWDRWAQDEIAHLMLTGRRRI